jgi:hypothetical protein
MGEQKQQFFKARERLLERREKWFWMGACRCTPPRIRILGQEIPQNWHEVESETRFRLPIMMGRIVTWLALFPFQAFVS